MLMPIEAPRLDGVYANLLCETKTQLENSKKMVLTKIVNLFQLNHFILRQFYRNNSKSMFFKLPERFVFIGVLITLNRENMIK
jgi:hypothetical protein